MARPRIYSAEELEEHRRMYRREYYLRNRESTLAYAKKYAKIYKKSGKLKQSQIRCAIRLLQKEGYTVTK